MFVFMDSEKLSTHCISIKCCKLCKKKKSRGNLFASIKSMYDSLLTCLVSGQTMNTLIFLIFLSSHWCSPGLCTKDNRVSVH